MSSAIRCGCRPTFNHISVIQDARNPAANRASQKADLSAMYAQLVHRHTVWTVENAASVVGYMYALS